jgi:hypothetical protein
MTAERTLRRPKRPRAYAATVALAAAILALGVAGTWRVAQRSPPQSPGFAAGFEEAAR